MRSRFFATAAVIAAIAPIVAWAMVPPDSTQRAGPASQLQSHLTAPPALTPPPTTPFSSTVRSLSVPTFEPFVADEILITLRDDGSSQTIRDIARDHELTHVGSYPVGLLGATVHHYRITRHGLPLFLTALHSDISGLDSSFDAPRLLGSRRAESMPHAIWILGRMYADGDGVEMNKARAYELFSRLTAIYADNRANTAIAKYVANAFVSLGLYHLEGIPGALNADPNKAREIFRHAASIFSDPEAQYYLGRLYLFGEGGPKDVIQAARWLRLSASNDDHRAQALLGDMLFKGEHVSRQAALGLFWLIVAKDSAAPDDTWIADMYDSALAQAVDGELAAALKYLEDWMRGQGNRQRDASQLSTAIGVIAADPRIDHVQPNYMYGLLQDSHKASPSPSYIQYQYALNKLRILDAHRISTGNQIRVAVIDSGIDAAHPELQGAVIAPEFNPIGGASKPESHGTAMAGAIASHGHLVGVAPAARILAVRAFSTARGETFGTTVSIVRGVDWATQSGARIVNMSFTGPKDALLSQELAAAHKRGIILIAAAGNAGPTSPPAYPAAYPEVIAVTASDPEDKMFGRANTGDYVAIAAPGVDILGPSPQNSYQLSTGTSVAAAHVSGVVALLLERRPSLDPDEVRRILMTTADALGQKMPSAEVGVGRVDAYQAILSLETIASKPAIDVAQAIARKVP
jgi:TPR repeat protein